MTRLKSSGLIILFIIFSFLPQSILAGDVTIIDSRHYSNVFGENRNFRIFLPPGYYDNPQSRYPVIYYYHGWSQRYFGSTTMLRDDEGESNKGDNIANFVAKHDVIVVKTDGYNRRPDENYYLRPYNIGPVETYRQFPLYFPEVVNFIDASYRTIPDRNHRAITGLSMGGFMTFWIGGKYPDLIAAAGNFCGSQEFVVGPVDCPVEYRHLDMAGNYAGVNVRLNYGNKDFIRYYHRDMNQVWTQVMDNYEYRIYEAEHTTCGLGEMFEFFMNTFRNPPEKPKKWDHIDVYPEFEVWGYRMSSDRDIPGFTILENVDKRGFRCSVREFLPDGETMPFVKLWVTTAPIYEKNQVYKVNDFDIRKLKSTTADIRSDSSGRLRIGISGSIHEIGINKTEDLPNLCIASTEIGNAAWATSNREVSVRIRLLNKGLSRAQQVKAFLSSTRSSAKVLKNNSDFGNIDLNAIGEGSAQFSFFVSPDSIEIEKFKLTIKDGNNHEWIDYFEIPIRRELPEIKNVVIADGRTFTVAASGVDSATIFLGTGNGDGVANPGESFVILVKEQNKYWRTELYTSDKFVNSRGTNIRLSDNWGSYDHVGGSAKYSVPLLSSECPENHNIGFFATYWLPNYPDHIIRQGKITVKVTGKDHTPPIIQWTRVSGDNTIHVKVLDGSEMKRIKVRFTSKDNPKRTLEAVLNDEGREGDQTEADNVFSKTIPVNGFGLFRAEITAVDSFENSTVYKCSDIFVLQ